MTRKNYVALADALGLALAQARYVGNLQRANGVWEAVEAIIPVLKADNPRFDQEKFTFHVEGVAEGTVKIRS